MSAQSLMEPRTPDTSSDVARVVEATRHLNDFREGFAKTLVWLAIESLPMMPVDAVEFLEPMLRILGAERAQHFGERLHRIACDAGGDYDGHGDRDRAQSTLEAVAREAAHAVADEFHRDSCICRAVGQ